MSFFSFLFKSNSTQNDFIKVLDKSSFKKAMASKKGQLIDVRTPKEFNAGHIENAKNIDFFDQGNFVLEFDKLDKNIPVFLYCRSGNRSNKAAQILWNIGFKEIFDLKGGYTNW